VPEGEEALRVYRKVFRGHPLRCRTVVEKHLERKSPSLHLTAFSALRETIHMPFRPLKWLAGGSGFLPRIAPITLELFGTPVSCCAQNWAGIRDPSRGIDWSHAGVQGVIPSRTTINITIKPGSSADAMNAAIAKSPSGQVVYLSAGTYTQTAGITFANHSKVTLRDSGPDQAFLIFTGHTSKGSQSC